LDTESLRDDMMLELIEDDVMDYILRHQADCMYAVYLSFDSKTELLDRRGRSGMIVLSSVHADDLLHYVPEKAHWWSPLRPLVAQMEVTQIFTGRNFGIPICVPDLTKNPVLGKYPNKPKPKTRKTFVRVKGLELKVGMIGPVPYFEIGIDEISIGRGKDAPKE
jgi:hypothetical protein